ncbi:hypothetical protein EJ07DRAFT_169873 [Lizonia empirigonia]|nr:hypothetical protein EJ07DRAFT_169873 [Lizonia empirigonia]
MKREHLLWLAASTAGATPLLQFGQGGTFDYPGLRFGADKKFSITVFSDLAPGRTLHSNLVVLNGDLTSCEFVAPENLTSYIDQVTAPLVERNMPFAATFGNHDMSKTCNTRTVSEHMWNITGKDGKKLSFTTSSVNGPYEQVGTSNYYIPVYASKGGGNPELSMMLWFFDSKGGRRFSENWVGDKVTSWFRLTRDAVHQQQGRDIPNGGLDPATAPGLNEELIGHQGDVCDSDNKCDYTSADSIFMKALVETKGLMGVFSGHDHGVDWCMKWSKDLPNNSPANGNGLNVCFNRHSGYGGYSDWARGGRQIVVEEAQLEDGSVSGQVTLNSTYGTDKYPKVAKLKSSGL